MKCRICNKDVGKHGHNALPIKDGRCCDSCNTTKVIPARIRNHKEGKNIYAYRDDVSIIIDDEPDIPEDYEFSEEMEAKADLRRKD